MRTPVCAASLLVAAVILAACAGRPTARDQVAASQESIEAAMAAAAVGAAPLNGDMAMARIKLARAQAALHVGDYERGRRLAEEAELDVQIAIAKLAAGKSLRAAAEVDASLAGVRGETPPAGGPVSTGLRQ